MKTGRNVVIVGRPNVGKSALFNRIAGRRIAIVHGQPGITRDRLVADAVGDGKKFRIWDTGGVLGAGETKLIKEVRASAEQAISEGDLLLLVVDAKDGLTPVDSELGKLLRRKGKAVLLVINKIDHPNHEPRSAEFEALGFSHMFSISAAHGRNLEPLLSEISRRLPAGGEDSEQMPARKIAIVGRPNAGKSSLVNALLREPRAIVSETPGTTRDSADITYEREGNRFVLIDTAGIRARSKHSSSVEVFSVMRAEKTIKRSDLCVLVIDAAEGVKAQDRRIARLIQGARKPCIIALNKIDLLSGQGKARRVLKDALASTRSELFFLGHAPILPTSALTGERTDRLFRLVREVERAAHRHIGTGKLNRLLQSAFASNPPAMMGGRRLKFFYATQVPNDQSDPLPPPEFILFVNSPRLVMETFGRYLEAKIREAEPYIGLPLVLTFRERTKTR